MKNKSLKAFLALSFFWIFWFFLIPFFLKLDPISQSHPIFLPWGKLSGLGSDDVGRDLMARVLVGGQYALALGVLSVCASLIIGIPFGILSAIKKSWLDEGIQRITDFALGFPSILLGIIVVTISGPGFWGLAIIITMINIPQIVRLARNLTVSELEKDYISGARALGANSLRLVIYHLLPSLYDSLIIVSTTMLGTAVLEAAGLSFLGLGIMPPNPEWGAMVAEYRNYILAAPSLFLIPSVSIVIFSGSYILLAEALRKLNSRGRT